MQFCIFFFRFKNRLLFGTVYSCREIGSSVQGSYGPTLCLASPVLTFLLIGTLVTIDEPTLTCYYELRSMFYSDLFPTACPLFWTALLGYNIVSQHLISLGSFWC